MAASPPRWEIGIYAAGALALLGIAALNLWKLWRSGTYPAPSPFPNYDYRYLEQKYGAACSDGKHKVKGQKVWLFSPPRRHESRWRGKNVTCVLSLRGGKPLVGTWCCWRVWGDERRAGNGVWEARGLLGPSRG